MHSVPPLLVSARLLHPDRWTSFNAGALEQPADEEAQPAGPRTKRGHYSEGTARTSCCPELQPALVTVDRSLFPAGPDLSNEEQLAADAINNYIKDHSHEFSHLFNETRDKVTAKNTEVQQNQFSDSVAEPLLKAMSNGILQLQCINEKVVHRALYEKGQKIPQKSVVNGISK